MQETRAASTNLDLRARQLEVLDRLAERLERGSRDAARMWGLLAFPLGLAMLVGIATFPYERIRALGRLDLLLATALVVPFPLHVALGWTIVRARRRLSRQVRDELQRRPVLRATSSCRSCGASLDVTTVQQVVRCPYCDTENVLDTREAHAAAEAELAAFDARVPKIIARIESGALLRGLATLAALGAGFIVGGLTLLVALRFADRLDRFPIDSSHRYALRTTFDADKTKDCIEKGDGASGTRRVWLDSLVGRVVVGDPATPCSGKRVTAAFADGLGDDHLACGDVIFEPVGTCLAP